MNKKMSESMLNDMVVRFANVNGTGSASANEMFARALFKMGIPVSAKNIFPSNIQGLPTWYEVRINGDGYLGRKEGIDLLIAVNPQSLEKDIASVKSGGYLLYDNSKKMYDSFMREDIHFIGVPMIELSKEHFDNPRQQQLFKNMIYVGAVCELIGVETDVIKEVIADQFSRKAKLIPPNHQALELGINYVRDNINITLPQRVQRVDKTNNQIVIDGNAACALGALYAGATIMAWYPITPSTSVAKAFESYCKKYRVDPDTGKKNYAFIQAEDELAAIGMVIGANWNGARAFTATSGPGVSLMNEFIGLSYFAEIPVVLINVQRGGPSTGMPTRTQQSDLLSCAYASHGDTKHPVLIPSSPDECFSMTAMAFDLAERLQTLVFVLTDLDLGMNKHLSKPLSWDSDRHYDRGKVLSAEDLEEMKEQFGRYLDVDGDGIPYRTIPGTHPSLGSYFTRGTSRDEYAKYTEDGNAYVRNVDRLSKKWETTKTLVPPCIITEASQSSSRSLLFYGTSRYAAMEASDLLTRDGLEFNIIEVKAFPFDSKLKAFIDSQEEIYVVDQNRDGQMRTLLMAELEVDAHKLKSILNYDGMPITADKIHRNILNALNKAEISKTA